MQGSAITYAILLLWSLPSGEGITTFTISTPRFAGPIYVQRTVRFRASTAYNGE
jgi:hypothetical protein